jgi:hypothetical protein
MSPAALAHALTAALLLCWACRDLWMLRNGPASQWLWATFVCLGLGEAAHVPEIYFSLEDHLGPGWGMVLRHLTGVGAATGVLLMADNALSSPARLRRLHRIAGVAALAGCTLPWLVHPPEAVPGALRGEPFYYDPTWRSAVHWTAFLTILGWALADNSVRCFRARRGLTDPRVRTGTLLVGTGTAVGLLYVAVRGATVVAWLAGYGPGLVGVENLQDAVTLGPSLAAIILGLLWNRILNTGEMALARRDVSLLTKRWTRLTAVLPEVSPWPHFSSRPARSPDHLRWQRTRLVVEIYDAMRVLIALVPQTVEDRVAAQVADHGLTGLRAVAAVEHISLELAIMAHETGRAGHEAYREPRLHAPDSASAARTIARRLRALERRRVRKVVRAVLEDVTVREAMLEEEPDAERRSTT